MGLLDELSLVPSGATFYRADFHIHSYRGSHDVTDAAMVPAKIVETAVGQKLSLIAITDHNEIVNVAPTLAAAAGSGVFVLPGIELTTAHGHLLVYFQDVATLAAYYGKLTIVDRGSPNSRCQTSMLECLNLIDPSMGFAVLAHVDGDGGLEAAVPGSPPHKSDILTHRALLGIELKQLASPVSYSPADIDTGRAAVGRKRAADLKLAAGQHLARVLFSDSHNLATLGKNAAGAKRLTRLKMDTPSFDGVRLAFQDAEARVRLEDEVPAAIPRILGIKLEGGFLDGQTVRLSPNLNCIIGGRGAGKSTLFEAVRTMAPHPSASRLIDSEIWPDRLSLVWVDEAGQRHTILREKAEAATNVDDPALGAVTFPIECYGQGETAETSNQARANPGALLEYLDKFVDLDELKQADGELRNLLLQNQSEIEKAQLQINLIPQYEKALAQAKQQMAALEKAKAKEVIEIERKVAEERGVREELDGLLSELVSDFKTASANSRLTQISGLADPSQLKVGPDQYRQIQELAKSVDKETREGTQTISERVQTFAKNARLQIAAWKTREREISDEIDRMRKELAAQGIKLDFLYIRKLAEDEAKHQKTVTNLKTWVPHMKSLRATRADLLARRQGIRSDISTRRTAYAVRSSAALQGALTDLAVSVKFAEGALSPEGEENIQEAMGWRTNQVPRASLIAEKLTIPGLLDAVRKGDAQALMALRDADGEMVFGKSDAEDILKRLGELPILFKLERCVVEDLPRVSVTKSVAAGGGSVSKPITRDFSKLSLGQQQSVLLALMMCADSTAPLLIDQPEDNLDSEFIYHSLVPVLRRAKERRQVIVVTHNPNIAVLGDAELVVALKGFSDKGQIMSRGSIDDKATRRMACQILEGTEEAFVRRSRVYGIAT